MTGNDGIQRMFQHPGGSGFFQRLHSQGCAFRIAGIHDEEFIFFARCQTFLNVLRGFFDGFVRGPDFVPDIHLAGGIL